MIRLFIFFAFLVFPGVAQAFCGFYVAKADADLFNAASKVVISRHEGRSVMTMANDFSGEVKDFAIVIPVPEIIRKSQVNVTENSLLDHLDAYTAPRLVEYYDSNPCSPVMEMMRMQSAGAPVMAMMEADGARGDKALGVTIEESYTVGEYDILILSAKESDGLLKWLNREGYKLPKGAEPVLKSYIKQDMKFFVAKVNLEEQAKSGYTYLRPLQVAYESDKFMLPVRLGTLNAKGPQDLLLFTLTKKGRVEPVNYRTVKIPTGEEVPLFVADVFGQFYKDMFAQQAETEAMKAVFLEYAWDMAWCDPCAADPLPAQNLRTLGAWWVAPSPDRPAGGRTAQPMIMPAPAPVDVFVTRMHIRYDAESFPEDVVLQVTEDRQNFQGRYVMRHPFTGESSCEAGRKYYSDLPERFEKEAKTLAHLTGWDIGDIRARMEKGGQSFSIAPIVDERPWWEQMWGAGAEKQK